MGMVIQDDSKETLLFYEEVRGLIRARAVIGGANIGRARRIKLGIFLQMLGIYGNRSILSNVAVELKRCLKIVKQLVIMSEKSHANN